jgi:tRNA(Arg) A34 adenosine deaminase TadA
MQDFMAIALEEARQARERLEVPIGAVIVKNGKIIAQAGNETRSLNDCTAHAEILAIRRAGELLQNERLTDCDLYVTLEPCAMCAGAISFARIRRLYYAVEDQKSGGVDNGSRFFAHENCHHAPEVYSGFHESEAKNILTSFFNQLR